jgi:MFS family permease
MRFNARQARIGSDRARLHGAKSIGIGYTTELFPTQIRGTATGASFCFGNAAGALAPAILGWIATSYSLAAGLPLLAFSFFLLVPLFLWFAKDTTRKELTDFIGQKNLAPEAGASVVASTLDSRSCVQATTQTIEFASVPG